MRHHWVLIGNADSQDAQLPVPVSEHGSQKAVLSKAFQMLLSMGVVLVTRSFAHYGVTPPKHSTR